MPGRFVVLHPGHIRLFRYARTLGEKVIVALEVTEVQHEDIEWRVGAIRGTSLVDEVILVSNDLSSKIEDLKPHFVLKGLEFKGLEFPEEEVLKSVGGQLVFSSGSYIYSETQSDEPNRTTPELKSQVEAFLERNKKSLEGMKSSLTTFRNRRIAVIGDSIVDEIIECQPIGMSAESPSLVVTPTRKRRYIGGAAIVAGHCAGLGAETTLLSARGSDEPGDWIESELVKSGVSTMFYLDQNRKTTYKQRFKSRQQVLLRLNDISPVAITSQAEHYILTKLEGMLKDLDAIILSDFSYGVLTGDLASSIIQLAKQNKIFVSADSQTSSQIGRLSKFCGVNLICPTELEARQELRDDASGLIHIVESLRNKLQSQNVLLKLGAEGVLLHGIKNDYSFLRTDQIPAITNYVIDTSGAGDAMLACATLALISKEDLYGAGFLGSVASSIQVSRIGNLPISSEEMMEALIKI